MAKIGVALFDRLENARGACDMLQSKGFDRSSIHLFSNAQDRGVSAREIYDTLVGYGVPENDAGIYAEGVQRGGSLVYLRTSDARAEEAADIMARFSFVDIDERAELWRRDGWSSFDLESRPFEEDLTEEEEKIFATEKVVEERAVVEEREIPETAKFEAAEEELLIGKREVDAGGVRVKSYVTETPVEEDVTLREEHVVVERHQVDRPLRDDSHVFEEREVEFSETREEPMVAKTAHVTEEVIVSKDVEEHTETIRDTLRRQDVQIEHIDESVAMNPRLDRYNNDFRAHFDENYATAGDYGYEDYAIGYRYGASLGEDPGYRGKDWQHVESHARTQWDERNKGTWEKFKDSVRYGWQKVRGEHPEDDQPGAPPA